MSYQAVTNQENQVLTNHDDSMPLVSAAVENLDAIFTYVYEDVDMSTNGVTSGYKCYNPMRRGEGKC